MSNKYNKLRVQSLANTDAICRPAHGDEASLDSPASIAMTNFRYAKPLILENSTKVREAVSLMRKAHVQIKLVVDQDEHFLGIVTRQILEGPKVLILAKTIDIDVQDVADVMQPRHLVHALSMNQVESSRIGDVLETMREYGDKYILVLDTDANEICGMIAADQIATLLHIPVEIDKRAASFADVVEALH